MKTNNISSVWKKTHLFRYFEILKSSFTINVGYKISKSLESAVFFQTLSIIIFWPKTKELSLLHKKSNTYEKILD